MTFVIPAVYDRLMSIAIDLDKIERRRWELGMKKRELARRAGITPQRLTQIYSEIRRGHPPFAPTFRDVVSVLGFELEDVVKKESAA